ncbi:putative ABC transport system permease protein [Parabacteroides sp. PFB2-10]|uniref:ABC transporter permease n=1 Tax=Parabacteroides sp. PFB2-10 TaxID=1742405 RepID=UPI0024761DD6|nr:ABC transporter permease [Parabacteroides sp. PFB2-10]MDH6314066.1 putative ABC transport system permease protein [Parabacteroides sp. PFB2-10]
MNLSRLIRANISFFTRYYRLVAIAVLITVAVMVGSLVVGDSVRTTLVKRVNERLGDTETIIFSRNSFMDEAWLDASLWGESAKGFLLTNGFIAQNGKLIPVFVWGTDEYSLAKGTAKPNQALAKELGGEAISTIILRLPATGLIPSGSLFVTENYTSSLRLDFGGIVEAEQGGNLSMKNEQTIPFNLFVNREELAEAMETVGKINLILTPKEITSDELNHEWNYRMSGLSVNPREGFTEILSDRVFLPEEVTHTIRRDNAGTNRLFSYLANSIEREGVSVPYSFVTAMDRFQGETLGKEEIILSDYTAKRLQAKPGDHIEVSYFVSQDLKTLVTKKVKLRVKKIVPLAVLQEDETLSADFPGLSDVERCTDWDSDLPIDMDRITDEDEKYWELYRTTPKAIIAYDAIATDWSNGYGNATALRINDRNPVFSALRAEMFGIQVIHPRETGLYAAKNGVDFSSLFLALGFFIIVSAILLMLVPLSEMLWQRREEIALLQSLGFSRQRISRILWRESAPVVLLSSLMGVIAGLLYTTLIMWLLGNVWKGATHTDGFAVYPGAMTILIGFIIGVALSLGLLWWRIRKSIIPARTQGMTSLPPTNARAQGMASLLAIGMIVINLFFLHNVILFVVAGVILIGTAALWGDYLIRRNGSASTPHFQAGKMIWSALLANRKQALLSFFALSTGVFIVFSVGLNRKGFADSSQIRTGTGGYSLWCESSVPVYHNMTTAAGKEKLSLTGLPGDAQILQCLRYGADDASCLNLNRVTTPTVLGVDMNGLLESDFQIEQNIWSSDRDAVFKRMQTATDSVYPALIDATVLTWGLMMNLGDTLHYENDKGQTVAIQLAGTLSNSIFQGHLLVDRRHFSHIWPETTGSEVFLLKVNETEKEEVKNLLSQALNEYGVRVSTTNDRLRQFNTVTDTYLTIFLTLGGLGLLLGIMSFIIVVRKNLSMRRPEIDLYRTLGFTDLQIEELLYRENRLVPLYAIATGVISSLVGVSLNFMHTSVWVWLLAGLFTAFFVIGVIVFIRKSVREILQE